MRTTSTLNIRLFKIANQDSVFDLPITINIVWPGRLGNVCMDTDVLLISHFVLFVCTYHWIFYLFEGFSLSVCKNYSTDQYIQIIKNCIENSYLNVLKNTEWGGDI